MRSFSGYQRLRTLRGERGARRIGYGLEPAGGALTALGLGERFERDGDTETCRIRGPLADFVISGALDRWDYGLARRD